MQRFVQRTEKGFTLIELIIVIAIIAIVVSAVFVAIDPVKRINDARNARSSSDADNIDKAIQLYMADGNPIGVGSQFEAAFESGIPAGNLDVEICPTNGALGDYCDTASTNTFDPDFLVQAGYLPSLKPAPGIPTTSEVSGYQVTYSGGAYTGVSAPTIISSTAASSSAGLPLVTSTYAMDFAPDVPSISGDRVTVPHSVSLNFAHTDAFSLSLWVKYDYDGNNFPLIYKQDENLTNGPGYSIRLPSNGRVYARITDSTNNIESHSNGSVAVGGYTHVVMTYDPAVSEANRITIYLNGTADTINDLAQPITGSIQNVDDFHIGYGRIGFTMRSSGNVDDVRVYKKVLTAQEITDLSNKLHVDNIDLVSYWKLDQGSGLVAADEKTTNPGALQNNPVWTTSTLTALTSSLHQPISNATTLWSANSYSLVDDGVAQPATPTGGADSITATSADSGERQAYNMNIPTKSTTQIKVWLYGQCSSGAVGVDIAVAGGVPTAVQSSGLDTVNAWHSVTFNGSWTFTQLNTGFVVGLTAPTVGGLNACYIHAMYAEVL